MRKISAQRAVFSVRPMNQTSARSRQARAAPVHALSPANDLIVCLVAGGAGFVGSHLCESLLGQNCFVYCLDNFSTGREENLAGFKNHEHFRLLDHDLNSSQKLDLPGVVDYVFHVAGVEAYANGLDVSLETLLVNSFGTKTLLELARKHSAKFLLASSQQVYSGFVSEASLHHYFGQGRTLEAENAFAEAKRFAEALTVEYVKKHQVNARIVRHDFLYGPRMNLVSGSMIARLFKEAVSQKTISVPGNGLTRLYPTYISDAVYGLVKAMFSQSSNGRVYGLVNPQMTTILNFAYLIRDQGDREVQVNLASGEDLYNFEFPEKGVLDSQELLGWYPKVEAKEGIRLTWEWLVRQSQVVPPPTESKKKPALAKAKKAVVAPAEFVSPQNQPPIQMQPEAPPPSPKPRASTPIPSFISPLPEKETLVPAAPVQEGKPPPDESTSPKLGRGFPLHLPALTLPFPRLNQFRWWLIGFCLAVVAVTLPVVMFALSTYQAVEALRQAQAAVATGEIDHMAQFSYQAQRNFRRSQRFLHALSWVTTRVGLRQQTNLADQFLRAGEYLAESTTQLAQAGESGQHLVLLVLGREAGDPGQQVQNLRGHLTAANTQLGFAEAELANLPESLFKVEALKIGSQLDQLLTQLPGWRRQLTEAERIVAILPALLQFHDKQTYLVLLQNDQELRPTGGFIGSFALLTVEKGKVLDFRVEDSYTADGQLKGYVEPPEAIKQYLGEDIWWFRDSNISPDFPTSAARASWFIQKEMDREVAGVIGINLRLVQNLLASLGPIYVPDYQEQVTADNIFERAEYHAEVNFFPGSTQKKDFLGSLSRALFENIRQLEPGQLASLAQVMIQSLNERAVMVWLPGTKEAALLNQYGWDGALRKTPSGLPGFGTIDVPDYVMPVEANFGVNKANYFVRRSTSHQISILKNGEIKEVFSLTLANTSTSEAWPGGKYKNYFRLYLPEDSRIEAVKVAKQRGTEGEILKSRDIKVERELDKRVLGVLVEVPPQEERVITVEYHRQERLPIEQPQVTYALYWQKQSGIGADPLQISLSYPLFLKPTKLSQEAVMGKQSLTFTTDSSQDRVIAVSFSR